MPSEMEATTLHGYLVLRRTGPRGTSILWQSRKHDTLREKIPRPSCRSPTRVTKAEPFLWLQFQPLVTIGPLPLPLPTMGAFPLPTGAATGGAFTAISAANACPPFTMRPRRLEFASFGIPP